MTLTVRSASIAGAVTASRALTHAEMDANWAHVIDSSNQSFVQSGSAATQTVEEKLRQTKAALDYVTNASIRADIVAGTNTADVTSYLQTAISTGFDIDFQSYTWHCVGLTQSTNQQCLFSSNGMARFVKNGNGVILTCTGNDLLFRNLKFDGVSASFTGNNWNITGNNPTIINCGSRDAAGRALLATGQRVVIKGSGDIWHTAGTGGTDWDIEIGVSGTATLYHVLEDIYSSQQDGGVLLTDVGGHVVVGGQFGKYKVAAGTLPSGVNGGQCMGARLLGAVDVEISNSIFSGTHFGAVAITFAAGTSGHRCSATDNIFDNGYTMTNNSTSLLVMDTFAGYKDGTFTPTIEGSSSAGTGTYTQQEGWYARVGKLVFFAVDITWTAHDGTGNIVVAGLPYASLTSAATSPFAFFVRPNGLTFSNALGARMQNGGTKFNLFTYATAASPADVAMDTVATIQVCGCYRMA